MIGDAMKKVLGKQLALYPMPIAVIGASDHEGVTWTLVAHMGILGHDHVLVSLASNHYINEKIKESGFLSINLVNEAILPLADTAGFISGHKRSKASLFEYELRKSPIIKASPLSMVCKVEDIYATSGFENFICSIEETLVEDDCLSSEGKIDYEKVAPILFDMPNYEYLKLGEKAGKCFSYAKKGE